MRPAVVVVVAALAGCAYLRPAPPPEPSGDPTRLVAQADELVRSGSPRTARRMYRKVVQEYPRSPAAASALYALGRLYVDPDGPLRDYGAAQEAFGRLIGDHPDSPHVPEARAWRAALSELVRAQGDVKRLRADLDRLKELDIEQEGH
ncbi:MAG TPA: tetratricopeptide repeat protein [Candidatus Binatia bacterium]|nr:tetratricopeptide repeat protein [Candidatus Binatia bacterium]